MGKGGKAFVKSWTKNPLENIATGGMAAAYKGGNAATGGKGPTSSSLGSPELLGGAAKIKGFEMPQNLKEAEMQVVQRQSAIAAGAVPSMSQMYMAQSLDQANRQANSLAASQRGTSNASLAFRQAQIGNQQNTLEGSQSAAIMGEQERRQADQLIAAQVGAARGVAMKQASANQLAETSRNEQRMQFLSSAGGSAATIAASDENSKTNIKPSEGESAKVISEFMNALKSYTYEYKKGTTQPGGKPNPEGEVKSVMAQDLEKSDLGKQMVTDTPSGKVVDYAQGMAPLFAAIAELNKRTKHLGKGK